MSVRGLLVRSSPAFIRAIQRDRLQLDASIALGRLRTGSPRCDDGMVTGSTRRHEEAEERHRTTAERHDEAAEFWEGQADDARASLHRDCAAHARAGAELERRWAELIAREDPDEPTVDSRTGPESVTDRIDRRGEAAAVRQEAVGRSEIRDRKTAVQEQAEIDRQTVVSERDASRSTDPEVDGG